MNKAFTLIGACVTLMLGITAALLVIYLSGVIIDRARTIEENRRRQYETNGIFLAESAWPKDTEEFVFVAPSDLEMIATNGEVRIELPDARAAAVLASVRNYTIEYATNVLGPWTSNFSIAATPDTARSVMVEMARLGVAVTGNRTGFWRLRE